MPVDLAKFLEESCHRFTEEHILKRKLTKREFNAYIKVQAALEEEHEVEGAISILESRGYTIIPPKPKKQ